MRVVMLGFRETGKSTYAVGLYGGLANAGFATLKLVGLLDAVGFLNEGLGRLAARQPILRTVDEQVEPIALTLRTDGGSEHELHIPDRSGEALRGTSYSRQWHRGLLDELLEARGLLLFVHPLQLRPGEPVETAQKIVQGPPPADDGDDVPRRWTPDLMPSDVQMVDILQEMVEAGVSTPIRVAVVVSAWDIVDGEEWDSPSSWLKERVALLAQFLEANADRFPSAAFGVSVQGSDFTADDATFREKDPWERTWAVDAAGDAVELAAPVSFLLSGSAPE